MEISEIRIKLMSDPNDRLKAFCSITLDNAFVIRDLKIIQGSKGPFVAMPSRKLTDKCPKCFAKNNLRAAYCNDCGHRLQADRALKGHDGRAKLYADVAHPINSECRDLIQDDVLRAFNEELVLAHQPGYVCRYDDYGEDTFAVSEEEDYVPANRDSGSADPAEEQPAAIAHGVDSHGREALQGPHSTVARDAEVAGVSRRQNGGGSEHFGEGIL